MRSGNYAAKIAALKAKINKKKDEIAKLNIDLRELETKLEQENNKELNEFMRTNNLSSAAAIDILRRGMNG